MTGRQWFALPLDIDLIFEMALDRQRERHREFGNILVGLRIRTSHSERADERRRVSRISVHLECEPESVLLSQISLVDAVEFHAALAIRVMVFIPHVIRDNLPLNACITTDINSSHATSRAPTVSRRQELKVM